MFVSNLKRILRNDLDMSFVKNVNTVKHTKLIQIFLELYRIKHRPILTNDHIGCTSIVSIGTRKVLKKMLFGFFFFFFNKHTHKGE